MRITVFGATGGIGQEIVRQALASGHQVTAVVRDPARFTVTGAGLEVFRADVRDPEALRPAVAGRDAVLSGLGARRRADAGIAAELTRSVLGAVEAEDVRRLLVVSAAPVGPGPERSPLLDRAMLGVINSLLKPVYDDLRAMEPSSRPAPRTGPPYARRSSRTSRSRAPTGPWSAGIRAAAGASRGPTWPTRCWR